MGDDITIGVTEIVNNIEVTAQPNDQIVDISVIDNTDEVTLNITPTVIEINVNKGSSYAKWGTILGTLGDQTDLANALLLKADLVDGKVPSYQLPSYVDDVIEVANYAALPTVGETGKIYITLDNNKIYRWSGSVYIEIASNNAVWGAITGTLSSQTDLQSALNAKANISGQVFTGAISATNLSGTNTGDQDLSGLVPNTRTLTINGTAYDLSANRSWTISAGVWGSITGTLSSQTDLQSALNLKANDNAVVHLAGSETITGSKTFNVSGANNINITNSSSFLGLNITNSSTGKGLKLDNTGLGEGFLLQNQNGRGFTLSNDGTGTGLALFCNGTGSGMFVTLGSTSTKGIEFQGNSGFVGSSIFINNISGSTGNIIRGQRIGSDVFVVDYLGKTTAPIFELQPNNTVGSSPNYIGQTMATNDLWKIYGNTIDSDRGELVFELGDNAIDFSANGQRFRFFYNASHSGTSKSPFILDYNDAIFDANVTANSFIKSSGTAAQILAADGSVITAGTNITISGGVISASGAGSLEFNATDLTVWNNGKGNIGTNTSFGSGIFKNITTGNGLSAFGIDALESVTSGSFNTAIGKNALNMTTSGSNCTSIGDNSLIWNTTGSSQTAIGAQAGSVVGNGSANQTSSNSVYVGAETKASANGNTNEIVIGHNAIGNGSNTVTLGNSSILTTILRGSISIIGNGTGIPGGLRFREASNSSSRSWIFSSDIDAYGDFAIAQSTTQTGSTYVRRLIIRPEGNIVIPNLGTGTVYSNAGALTNSSPSDERLKENITDLGYGLNEILQLRPVSYNWINDTVNQGTQFGFIAQEVQEIMPELINEFTITEDDEEFVRLGLDKEGIYAALVNAIKELKAEIEILKAK